MDGTKADEASSSSSSATQENRMVTLKSSDGEVFVLEEAVAKLSTIVANLVEDLGCDAPIPVYVDSVTLASVIDFCKRQLDFNNESEKYEIEENKGKMKRLEKLNKERHEELQRMEWSSLFKIIQAANYLAINDLLDVTCQEVADRMKDMSVERIRKTFNIENDYTTEEEEAVRKENEWAFE